MRGGMDEVELVEAGAGSGDGAPEPEPQRARRRVLARVLRRWWPVPTVLVVALVGWHVVTDGRERAAVDRLREVPGVLAETVTAPLTGTAWGDGSGPPLLAGSVPAVDGTLLGLTTVWDGGDPAVHGIDPATGTEVWRLALAEDDPDAPWATSVDCSPEQEPVAVLWCTHAAGDPGGTAVVRTLLRVDVATRSIAGRSDLPASASVTVADGALVVATPAAEELRLRATDPTTGAERWTAAVPSPSDPLVIGAGFDVATLSPDGSHLIVSTSAGSWSLDPTDGRVEATITDGAFATDRGGRLVGVVGSSQTLLLGRDGSGTAVAEGTLVTLGPDDGSVPDLLLLTRFDGSGTPPLRAVDATTGEVVWEEPVGLSGDLVLLDGVLYGVGSEGLWARDAATGAVRWTAGGPTTGTGLVTDGRSLLRVEQGATSTERLLVAYDLTTGARRWTTPLPDGVTSVTAQDGTLYGSSATGLLILH
jgi:outer membrane protein assembly factor BamB